MNDEELFNSAMTEAAPEIEAPAEPEVIDGGHPRDEHGRFAAKAAEPEPEAQPDPQAAAPQTAKDEAHVPSWRLREERELREAAERRFQEFQAQSQRQIAELQARLPKEASQMPDPDTLYTDPNGFVGSVASNHVQQAMQQLKQEFQQQLESNRREEREYYSYQRAVEKFGPEKVAAAVKWIRDGFASNDYDAKSVHQAAFDANQYDPIAVVVQAHQQREVAKKIGPDPDKWRDSEVDRLIASDPQYAAALLQKIQQSARGAPQQQGSTVRLPPSLNRIASAQSAADASGDMSDASLFENAMR